MQQPKAARGMGVSEAWPMGTDASRPERIPPFLRGGHVGALCACICLAGMRSAGSDLEEKVGALLACSRLSKVLGWAGGRRGPWT